MKMHGIYRMRPIYVILFIFHNKSVNSQKKGLSILFEVYEMQRIRK